MNKLAGYLRKNPKKYFVFDFDETIAKMDIDWSGWKQILMQLYKEYDSNFENPENRKLISYSNDFVKKYGEEVRLRILKEGEKYEIENTKGLIPNPQLVEFIKNSNGYVMYIFSNNSRKFLEKALIELSIADKFREIICRESVRYLKPNTEGFRNMKNIETNKNEYLFIGDGDSDEQAAKNIGIDFFRINFFHS